MSDLHKQHVLPYYPVQHDAVCDQLEELHVVHTMRGFYIQARCKCSASQLKVSRYYIEYERADRDKTAMEMGRV